MCESHFVWIASELDPRILVLHRHCLSVQLIKTIVVFILLARNYFITIDTLYQSCHVYCKSYPTYMTQFQQVSTQLIIELKKFCFFNKVSVLMEGRIAEFAPLLQHQGDRFYGKAKILCFVVRVST